MSTLTRRFLLKFSAAGMIAASSGMSFGSRTGAEEIGQSVEKWMDTWMEARKSFGLIHVARFKEPIYVLTQPISWKPDPGAPSHLKPVNVPTGFVTDFASIPPAFFSLLRPDGEYTFPAIIHDYLYWTLEQSRESADEILRIGMGEFGIDRVTMTTIYQAVVWGGRSSWDTNAELRRGGEKRVLRVLPNDPGTRWYDWKKRPDVFY